MFHFQMLTGGSRDIHPIAPTKLLNNSIMKNRIWKIILKKRKDLN